MTGAPFLLVRDFPPEEGVVGKDQVVILNHAFIKDIAAASVGIAMLAWLLVLGFEAGEMLRKLP